MITVICAYCKAIYGHKPANGSKSGLSHGICPKCLQAELAKMGVQS